MNLPGMEPLWRAAVVDPPWQERGGGGRGAQEHYPLLTKEGVADVLWTSGLWRPHQYAHLYLWSTNSFLPDAMWLMNYLGFRYVTNLPWVKPSIGLGQYFLGRHELLLFGVRGKGMDPSVYTGRSDLPGVIVADYGRDSRGRRVHSAKPREALELVEARSHGPYAEFFCRGTGRPGWLTWGDQATQQEAAP